MTIVGSCSVMIESGSNDVVRELTRDTKVNGRMSDKRLFVRYLNNFLRSLL